MLANGHARAAATLTSTTSPLASLPHDLVLLIAAHLQPADIAALSQTSAHLLHLVDQLVWRSYLQRHRNRIPLDRITSTTRHRAAIPAKTLRRSEWWYGAKYLFALRRAWRDKVLIALQTNLPLPQQEEAAAPNGSRPHRRAPPVSDFHRSAKAAFAIPFLVLGRKRLVVAIRSDLYIFYQSSLAAPPNVGSSETPLDFSQCQTLHLNSHATPSDGLEGSKPGPWQDITAIKGIDPDGQTLLVGFADGTVQHLCLDVDAKDGAPVSVRVVASHTGLHRQEIADVSSATLSSGAGTETLAAWLSKRGALQIVRLGQGQEGKAGDIDSPTASSTLWRISTKGEVRPDSGLPSGQASTSANTSDGEEGQATPPRARIYRSVAFNNAPATTSPGGRGTRAWCVHLGEVAAVDGGGAQRWLAVGMTGDPALFVYTLDDNAQPMTTYALASSGRQTSVFALATAPPWSMVPAHLLFAGFYDGAVRVYDLRQIALVTTGTGTRDDDTASTAAPVAGTLEPIATLSDAFDDTAVYSLTFGGVGGCKLLAGNSVHARVRVWDLSALAAQHHTRRGDDEAQPTSPPPSSEEEGLPQRNWTVFTAYPSTSPQYSIVADAERVWGVTDRKLWSLDFGAPCLDLIRADSGSGSDRGVVEDEAVPHIAKVAPNANGRGQATTGEKRDDGTVAFFEHGDGLLKRSRTAFAVK